MARPKKKINKKEFESLCAIQCTKKEICYVFDVTEKTLSAWCRETYKKDFAEVFQQKKDEGRAILRQKQWLLANTSPAMAIWLGKQYLDQREKQAAELQAEQQILIDNIKTMNDIFSVPAANRSFEDLESN